ncbi:MAG: IclR family transcriptional regulator [Pseudomonadota bacterium]
MDGQEIHKNQGIQVITRAASILRVLGEETDGLSLGQIAGRVNLPRSTVQRIVAALALEGFVSTEKGYGGIRLGAEIQTLAQATATDIKEALRPVMQEISKATGETVDLARLEGNKMLFIDQIVGSQRLRTVSSIGEAFPLTTTANGKAALACLELSQATNLILAELEMSGDARPVSMILAEIEDIRAGVLARDEGEHTDGISAVGFGVRDQGGDVYAISVPVPSTRFERVKSQLIEAVNVARGRAGL